MTAMVVLLGIILIILVLLPNYYHLSKVFRVLKVITAISLLAPILAIVWLFSISSDPTVSAPEYIPDLFGGMLLLSIACIGGLASAWLIGCAYWLYAKKTNLFEISSLQLALMLIAAIAGWMAIAYLLPLMLFGRR